MKTRLLKEFRYDGLGFLSKDLPPEKVREVTLLGVPTPVDPGMVAIQDGDKVRRVPTFVLETVPTINFGNLLSDAQREERNRCGILFGPGSTDEAERLIPIERFL